MRKRNRFEELEKHLKPTTQKNEGDGDTRFFYVKNGKKYITNVEVLNNSRYIGFFPIN